MERRDRHALAGVLLLAAVLRLPTLGLQSLWSDEAATAAVLDVGLGDLLSAVADSESTPPLFYLLAWPAVQVLGDTEVALRLVSALCGIAAVGMLAMIGQRLGGARAMVVCGLLAATNPLLVWFSQEARAYSLLLALCALAVLALLHDRRLVWGLAAAGAVATHYFAGFLIVPMAVWLLRTDRRPALLARTFGPPLLAGLALVPLFLDQREAGRAGFIAADSLPERLAAVPKQWVVGYDAPGELILGVLAGALVAAGVVALLRRPARSGRAEGRAGRRSDGLGAVRGLALVLGAAVTLPVAAALVGDDYVLTRNLLPALAVALPLVGLGLTRLPPAVPAALAAVWVGLVAGVALDPLSQREDWRGAVQTLGPPRGVRIVVVLPPGGRPAAARYLAGTTAPLGAPALTDEVSVLQVASGSQGSRRALPALPPGPGVPIANDMKLDSVVEGDGYRVATWTSVTGTPIPVSAQNLDATLPPVTVLLQQPY